MAVANISELGASRFASVILTAARVRSTDHSRRTVVVLLHMRRVISRVLHPVVLRVGGDLDVRIGAPVMAVIRWGRLPRGVVAGCEGWRCRPMRPTRITRQRRQSGRIGWDRARIGAAVISE